MLLREAKQEYNLTRSISGKINRLIYMDDLKLFGKLKNDLKFLVQTVWIYTEFGLPKYATLVMKRGQRMIGYGYLTDR